MNKDNAYCSSFILQISPAWAMHNQALVIYWSLLLWPTPKIQVSAHMSLMCAFLGSKGWTASPRFLCSLASGWSWQRGGEHGWSYPITLAMVSFCAGTVVWHSSAKGTVSWLRHSLAAARAFSVSLLSLGMVLSAQQWTPCQSLADTS